MFSYIIKAFLPWVVFFALADGSQLGLKMGAVSALFFLFLFNFGALRKFFMFAWVTLVFFIAMFVVGAELNNIFIIKHDLFLTYITLAIVCFASVLIHKPFTQPYACLCTHKTYWDHPLFNNINKWVSLVWGFVFFINFVLIGFFTYGIGSKLWMMQILPTVFIVIGIFFNAIFPDYYKALLMRKNGIASIKGISSIQSASLGNVTIGYRTLGEGPLLVLLCGAHMNMHSWPPELLRKLSEKFKLLIFDYPGIGFSRYKKMPYTAETLAACLNGLLEKLELNPLAIIGVSLGGMIGQAFVKNYADKVKSLVLVNTDFGGAKTIRLDPSVQQKAQALSLDHFEEKIEQLIPLWFPQSAINRIQEKFREIFMSSRLGGEVTKKAIEKIRELLKVWYSEHAVFEALPKVSLPTLIISGKQDIVIPPTNAELLKDRLKNAKHIEYDDAGHGIIYQYPFDIADQITAFVSGLKAH